MSEKDTAWQMFLAGFEHARNTEETSGVAERAAREEFERRWANEQ